MADTKEDKPMTVAEDKTAVTKEQATAKVAADDKAAGAKAAVEQKKVDAEHDERAKARAEHHALVEKMNKMPEFVEMKTWLRRELELYALGHSRESREKINP